MRSSPYRRVSLMLAGTILVTVASAVVVVVWIAPQKFPISGGVFGVGLAVTAWVLGARHAFDPDHIAAIDNTTRRLMREGRSSQTLGFWFALGHSSVVVGLAALVSGGSRMASTVAGDGSTVHHLLSALSTSVSGLFLIGIGALNLIALVAMVRLFRAAREHGLDADALDTMLDRRGLIARLLRRLTGSISRPIQMFPIGLLFGIGFDTASEVTLLALAGSGAATGLPWYAVMTLPVIFACGMTLFDTIDSAFMTVAYGWALINPIRKIYYNIVITGLSVLVALVIGAIELVAVLHAQMYLNDPVTNLIAGLDLNNVGYLIVALFALAWGLGIGFWKLNGNRIESAVAPLHIDASGPALRSLD